jgi:hypothetical protein
LSVNGTPIAGSIEPRMRLADFLRDKCAWLLPVHRVPGQGIVAAAHRTAETMRNSVTQR